MSTKYQVKQEYYVVNAQYVCTARNVAIFSTLLTSQRLEKFEKLKDKKQLAVHPSFLNHKPVLQKAMYTSVICAHPVYKLAWPIGL